MINPVAEYKNIRHYYLFTSQNIYHLHIYLGIRTGDSWLKNYELPFDDFIKQYSYKDKNKINLLSNDSFHLLFIARTLIKNSTLIGRFLYANSSQKYRKESEFIDYRKIDYAYKEKFANNVLDFIKNIEYRKINHDNLPDISECKMLIKSLREYHIFDERLVFFKQLISLFIRISNKLIFHFNKILFSKAKIITIYGSDGSGKTTLVNCIFNVYSPYFPCSKVHLGKPFSGSAIFSKIYKGNYWLYKKHNNKKFAKNISIKSALRVTLLSILRLVSSYIQILKRFLGVTVITDRWPSDQPLSMDGPKIYKTTNIFILLLNKLNIFIYKIIPKSDFVIILNTDLKYILKRNSQRMHPEPAEFIISRYNLKNNSNPKSKNYIFYENNKNRNDAVNDCLEIISKFLASN